MAFRVNDLGLLLTPHYRKQPYLKKPQPNMPYFRNKKFL